MVNVIAKRAASNGVRMTDIVMFFLVEGFINALN
tara:strand:+ start:1467 stop:1568 length:102 start_codon:yes stop_codon:yes gene_type:complete